MRKKILPLILVCGLAACGRAPASAGSYAGTRLAPAESMGGTGSGDAAPAESSSALRLSQSRTVYREIDREKAAYPEFFAKAEPFATIPGLKEGMTPQGMGVDQSSGKTFIASYAGDNLPSAVTVLSADGQFSGERFLYRQNGEAFSGHVGGLAVAEDTLYLSDQLDHDGGFSIVPFFLGDFTEAGSRNLELSGSITLPVSPSFLNYSEGYLWVGNFYYPDAGYDLGGIMKETTPSDGEEMGTYILGYDLSSQGGARMRETGPDGYPVPDLVLAATDRIQGMTVLQDHSILLSQSYGRKNPSALLHYAAPEKEGQKTAFSVGSAKVEGYVLDSRLLLENITAPPMTEAVAALPGGIVQVNFESGAMRYDDGRDRTDQLWRMKLE